MEKIYCTCRHNTDNSKHVRGDPRGSSRSKKCYLAIILFLGLLSICLLAGTVVLYVHLQTGGDGRERQTCQNEEDNPGMDQEPDRDSDEAVTRLHTIKHDLTQQLQACSNQLSFLTEERDQLRSNLTKMTKELKHASKLETECPAGWRRFSRSCYLLSTTSGSWDAGRKDCRGRGGDLVVIDSSDEQTFLSTLTKQPFWIGLSDNETEGTWKWVDGSPLILSSWESIQPDNGNNITQYGEEDCAQIRTTETTAWNDVRCDASLQWFCEK